MDGASVVDDGAAGGGEGVLGEDEGGFGVVEPFQRGGGGFEAVGGVVRGVTVDAREGADQFDVALELLRGDAGGGAGSHVSSYGDGLPCGVVKPQWYRIKYHWEMVYGSMAGLRSLRGGGGAWRAQGGRMRRAMGGVCTRG